MRPGGNRQRPAKRLKDGLKDMMPVFAMEQVNMQGQTGVENKGSKKLFRQRGIEGSDFCLGQGHLIVQIGPIGKISADPGKGFIHGNIGMTVAANTRFVAKRLLKSHPQTDSQILDGVMIVDLDITMRGDFQIKETVNSKQGKHVIQKTDTGMNGGSAHAIKGEDQLDIGFSGLTMNRRSTGGVLCHYLHLTGSAAALLLLFNIFSVTNHKNRLLTVVNFIDGLNT
jgi:hypothetical protein